MLAWTPRIRNLLTLSYWRLIRRQVTKRSIFLHPCLSNLGGASFPRSTPNYNEVQHADFHSLSLQAFKEFRAELVRCERYVLRELGFMVSQILVHPHRFILHYIHALFKSTPQVETNRLCQLAWGYLNDRWVFLSDSKSPTFLLRFQSFRASKKVCAFQRLRVATQQPCSLLSLLAA